MIPRVFAVASLIVTVTGTNAQFTGPYAPDTWTVAGTGSAVFALDGGSLIITGPDLRVVDLGIDVTHSVVAAGTWTFDWQYTTVNSTGFDHAYYLINGIATELAGDFRGSGRESIPVGAGDIIGWRVDTVAGLFGPGVLTVTGFQIPAPATLALLGLASLCRGRRR
jgi:hypothetical protein